MKIIKIFVFTLISSFNTVASADCNERLQEHPGLSQKIQNKYGALSKRFLNLEDGEILEGSSRHGGMQPDYKIDINSDAFDDLKAFAKDLASQKELSYWTRISSLTRYIQEKMLYNREYDNQAYQALAAHYKYLNLSVPLSAYVKSHVGVCRENAMILHFALKWMGIDNRFLYVHINENIEPESFKEEDHAVVVVLIDGELRVVDSYNFLTYTGHRLEHLLGSGVTRMDLKVDELINGNTFQRRFERINDYPRVLHSDY